MLQLPLSLRIPPTIKHPQSHMTTSDTTRVHPHGVALELPVDRWIPITKAYAAFDGPFPVAVTFDDGEIRQVSSWRDVYGQVASWLALTGKMQEDVDFPANQERSLVSHDGTHSDGSDFERPYLLPNGLWLDISGEERLQRDLAIVLLRELEVDPSSVMVMLAHG